MSQRVNLDLLMEIKKYGAADISACFNCGNCTAVCPLTEDDETFPRRIIRYTQLGMEDRLLGSKELWMCYNCGECSETCPRQAEPGEFMAAARRYAIAKYDRSGLAQVLFTSPVWSITILVVLACLFALFMYTQHADISTGGPLRIFDYVPMGLIHNIGIAVLAVVGVIGALGVVDMVRRITRANGTKELLASGKRLNWWTALWDALFVETLAQKRYREDCETTEDKPWYIQKWFLHATTMWGFLGLLVATASNFFLDTFKLKTPGVPNLFIHTLGTVAGVFLVYGVSLLIYKRLKPDSSTYTRSHLADWILLVLLWLAGVSGFALEILNFLPQAPLWGYYVFLFHVAVSMEVTLLVPLIKFGHAFYRPVALFFHALKPVSE